MLENNNFEQLLNEANEKIKSLEAELIDAKENNEIYSSTEILKSAKKIKNELIEDAQKESDEMIKSAERQSEKYRTETMREAEEYKDKVIKEANNEVNNIKLKRDEYQKSYDQLFNQLISMRDIINSVLNVEDHPLQDDILTPLNTEVANKPESDTYNTVDDELSSIDIELIDNTNNQDNEGDDLDIVMEDIPLNL